MRLVNFLRFDVSCIRFLSAWLPRLPRREVLASVLVSLALATHAYAASPCYQWEGYDGDPGPYFGPWETNANTAAQDVFTFCMDNPNWCGSGANCPPAGVGTTCDTWAYSMTGTFPRFSGVTITYVSHYPDGSTHPLMFSAGMSVQNNPVGTCQPYVSAIPPTAAQCPTCNPVTDPINPANGAMYVTQKDLGSPAGVLEFKRFYTSTNSNSVDLSTGWRHSYQRSISGRYAGTGYAGGYIVAPSNSSLYSDEATACTSGFSQIQGQVIGWSSATASYANGVCTLAIGANVIGTLPILYSSVPTVDITTAPLIGYDAIRDDGQSVSFLLNGTTITQPPSIALQLKQTSGGFTLTDEKDNTEAYDSNGRLLSVSTRGGIVQTANYDSSGRLSTVTDSFGHQLSVAYDSQSRVSSATLQ